MSTRLHHLVGVWNPTYEADAMDAHVRILLDAARERREGKRDDDDVYVWWGKVRSQNRQKPLPHLKEILAIDNVLASETEEEPELHLYLTDYRSLYVAHLGAIKAEDMSDDEGHVPDYYRAKSLNCDCWFQLWDIRRVVLDDTPAVVHELSKLRNVAYNDRPVSLYGGMVDLPLIVWCDEEARYFDEETREALTGGRYWVEFDAERAGAGAMQQELRENRFGNDAWSALDPAARSFIATAEKLFRDHRNDAAFDLSAVIVNFAKAIEVQANAVFRAAMAGAEARIRNENVEGKTRDMSREGSFSLGQLARMIGGDRSRVEYLTKRLANGDWFASSLPPILDDLAQYRNAAAHRGTVSREDVVRWRNRLIGVGSKGDLLELAQVRWRSWQNSDSI